jgi:hypothetical protein
MLAASSCIGALELGLICWPFYQLPQAAFRRNASRYHSEDRMLVQFKAKSFVKKKITWIRNKVSFVSKLSYIYITIKCTWISLVQSSTGNKNYRVVGTLLCSHVTSWYDYEFHNSSCLRHLWKRTTSNKFVTYFGNSNLWCYISRRTYLKTPNSFHLPVNLIPKLTKFFVTTLNVRLTSITLA